MSDDQVLAELKCLRADVARLQWLLVTLMKTDELGKPLRATIRKMVAEAPAKGWVA